MPILCAGIRSRKCFCGQAARRVCFRVQATKCFCHATFTFMCLHLNRGPLSSLGYRRLEVLTTWVRGRCPAAVTVLQGAFLLTGRQPPSRPFGARAIAGI